MQHTTQIKATVLAVNSRHSITQKLSPLREAVISRPASQRPNFSDPGCIRLLGNCFDISKAGPVSHRIGVFLVAKTASRHPLETPIFGLHESLFHADNFLLVLPAGQYMFLLTDTRIFSTNCRYCPRHHENATPRPLQYRQPGKSGGRWSSRQCIVILCEASAHFYLA